MNARHQELYQNLMALTVSGDMFYFQDFALDGLIYRIFNYRLSSYSDFLKPDALECRGIMFEVDSIGTSIRLVSRPMSKFFNIDENPFTMGLDLSKVDTIELKADGSLISTFIHNGELRLKSKGSLFSEQAIDAMKWLETQPDFARDLHTATDCGWTVNMEWCAIHNRVVIGYLEPHLKVLNARNNATGKYQSRTILELEFGKHCIDRGNTNGLDTTTFVQSIPDMLDDIEGYVARIGDLWFKIKTEKYLSLHALKDSVNNPRRLFEAIVDEGIDDLRSSFATDALAMQTIDEMQIKVNALFNSMVKEVTDFCSTNKDLDRKSFAIKGQAEVTRLYFGLCMTMYQGKEVDFKGFMKSHYKYFGFTELSCDEE